MAIEDILRRIDEEAEAKIAEILAAAEKEAARVKEDYALSAEKLKTGLDARIAAMASAEERRAIVNAQLEMRKRELERKHEIMKEIYKEARKRIELWSQKEYLDALRDLILRHVRTGREEIIVPASQSNLFDTSFLDSLNKSRDGLSLSISMQKGEFFWGVVLHEGERSVDLTLDTLFAQLSARIESRLANALFSY